MNKRFKLLVALSLVVLYSCNHRSGAGGNLSITPDLGNYKAGDAIPVHVHGTSGTPDSVVYLLDSARFISKKDTTGIVLKTDTLKLGFKSITAKVYSDGKSNEVSTNIVLLAANAPEEYTYKIEKVYPHDTSSYTEGLEYHDGYLYESTGNEGHSTLRKVNLETGKAVQVVKLESKYFGEGITMIDNKIIQLTYRQKTGFVYDKNTLSLIKTFPYATGIEGWGMCNDGTKIYTDDSTDRIWTLDKNDYHATGYIDVCDNKTKIDSVNELEYVDNKLYSNVYTKDTILVINPKTGAVLQRVDMKNLWPLANRPANYDNNNNVLNGIAWGRKG